MHLFLTGGTGLLGSHLAELLVSGGHRVVALHRPGADTSFLSALGCRLVEGDVQDGADRLATLMEGCTHLVHGAALVYVGGSWPAIRAVNVDGTRNVLTAAHRSGIRHAVHISSVAAYGPVPGPVDEDTPLDTPLHPKDLYARSKREAEEVARGIARAHGLPVTVVRPSAVYGERDRLMVPALRRILRFPVVPLFGPGSNTVPVVYAGNVADALRAILEAGPGAGDTFDVGLDRPLTQRLLMEGLCRGLGKRVRFLRIPAPLVRAGARTLEALGAHPPGAAHLSFSRVAELALGDNPYPSRRIREALGWQPPHAHEDALPRTGRWARKAIQE